MLPKHAILHAPEQGTAVGNTVVNATGEGVWLAVHNHAICGSEPAFKPGVSIASTLPVSFVNSTFKDVVPDICDDTVGS